MQLPQWHKNQNVARNWAVSPYLRRKIQSCPFCLKLRINGIWKVLIPNPDLHFQNSDPKIDFCANLEEKSQSCPFCMKIGTQTI